MSSLLSLSTNYLTMADLTCLCVEAALKGVKLEKGIRKTGLRSLGTCLEPKRAEKKNAHETMSSLTPNGFPVAISFKGSARELCLEAEIGGNSMNPERGLGMGAERFHDLGHVLDPYVLAQFEDIQGGHALKYGARAGIRVTGTEQVLTLFVEVPKKAQELALLDFNPPNGLRAALVDGGASLSMLGLSCDDEVEYYFDLQGMHLDRVPALYEKLGMPDAGSKVLDAIKIACGLNFARANKGSQNRICIKKMHNDEWSISVICEACDVFSSGAENREAVLNAAEILGADMSSYEVFSRAVSQESCENRHCRMTFSVGHNGKIEFEIGLSPTPRAEVYSSIDGLQRRANGKIERSVPTSLNTKPLLPDHISKTVFPTN